MPLSPDLLMGLWIPLPFCHTAKRMLFRIRYRIVIKLRNERRGYLGITMVSSGICSLDHFSITHRACLQKSMFRFM